MTTTPIYLIRVRGQLDEQWTEWFSAIKLTSDADSTTLVAPVRDQAELHGLLARVRDAGLELLSVTRDEA